jgi:hypothetical protein
MTQKNTLIKKEALVLTFYIYIVYSIGIKCITCFYKRVYNVSFTVQKGVMHT